MIYYFTLKIIRIQEDDCQALSRRGEMNQCTHAALAAVRLKPRSTLRNSAVSLSVQVSRSIYKVTLCMMPNERGREERWKKETIPCIKQQLIELSKFIKHNSQMKNEIHEKYSQFIKIKSWFIVFCHYHVVNKLWLISGYWCENESMSFFKPTLASSSIHQ